MSISRHNLYKELGVCPNCQRKPEKGNIYCPACAQKRREASLRHYYKTKERMNEDPEFQEHEKARTARNRIRHREKYKAEKRCYVCGRPATHGVFCTKHWQQNIEKASDHPYRNLTKKRPKLPVPQVSDKTRTDVGKLIALYNAGWSYKYIELDMKIGHSTISRYVKMAKEANK